MAEKKQVISKMTTDPTGTEVDLSQTDLGIAKQNVESMKAAMEDPIRRLTNELWLVANGKGVPDLRRMVDELFPKDRIQADAFMKKLTLLKLGSEAVVQTAQELYGGMANQ